MKRITVTLSIDQANEVIQALSPITEASPVNAFRFRIVEKIREQLAQAKS